jgi:hypothetical protein
MRQGPVTSPAGGRAAGVREGALWRAVARPSLVAVGALAGLVGCASLDARVLNLQQLHQEDGKVSYWADLTGDTSYLVRQAFRVKGPLGLDLTLPEGELDEEFIANPSSECLEILLSLDEFPIDDRRARSLRAEVYAWLLVGDPYLLARERCALELGPIGKALGVTRTLTLDEDAESPGPEELTPLLTDLVSAASPVLAGSPTPEQADALRAACDALLARELDIPAGRRVLRAAGALAGASGASRPAFEPVRSLADDVARRMVAVSLTRGLDDPSPLVHAAVLEAWTVATGNRAGDVLVMGLRGGDPTVRHRVCKLVARHGLPSKFDAMTAEEADAWREQWIATLVTLAAETLDGHVSAAACEALRTLSGGALDTLRFEEWGMWFERRLAARADTAAGPVESGS